MTCQHEVIQTYFFTGTGEPSGLWACTECKIKFIPITELATMTQDRDSLKITASRALDGEATLRDQLAAMTQERCESPGIDPYDSPLWVGCVECDCDFPCYEGKTRCIRLESAAPDKDAEERIREERERCAQLAEDTAAGRDAEAIAEAIRSLK